LQRSQALAAVRPLDVEGEYQGIYMSFFTALITNALFFQTLVIARGVKECRAAQAR
jgi:hypothetical protein